MPGGSERVARGRRAERAATTALVITAVLALGKLVVWWVTDSLAIVSQALDSVLDLLALGLVLVAVRIAARPADETHHYGHSKAENLVAFTQTLLLGAVVVAVATEAVLRLTGEPPTVRTPWYSFALLGVSAVVDTFRVRLLTEAARAARSDALRAGALNIATDLATALVAIASLAFVGAGFPDADPIGALIVSGAVAVAAVRLGKRSVDVLMDRAPHAALDAISAAAAATPGVSEARRVRLRGTERELFADVTVATGRTASLERAHDIAEAVERRIEEAVPGADVVVHVEPASETAGLVEKVQAAASRAPGVSEVHNVYVRSVEEAGAARLHVTLHAKMGDGTSLGQAHAMSDLIEDEVRAELGPDVRVDTHIEPIRAPVSAHQVTTHRDDLVREVRALASSEPDIADCHEVVVTSVDGRLSVVAHVGAAGDLPLARVHDASERIEQRLRRSHPEVDQVLIHFEPA